MRDVAGRRRREKPFSLVHFLLLSVSASFELQTNTDRLGFRTRSQGSGLRCARWWCDGRITNRADALAVRAEAMGGEHARALGHGRQVGDEVLGPGPRVKVHLPGDEVNRVYDVAASFLHKPG